MSAADTARAGGSTQSLRNVLNSLLHLAHERSRIIENGEWDSLERNTRQRDRFFPLLVNLAEELGQQWPLEARAALRELGQLDKAAAEAIDRRARVLAMELEKISAGRRAICNYMEPQAYAGASDTDFRFMDRQS